MLPLDPRTIGVIILSLLALLVVVKRVATGTVLGERPQAGLGLWVSHVYNMSFLLVVNPLAGLLLVARRLSFLRVGKERQADQRHHCAERRSGCQPERPRFLSIHRSPFPFVCYQRLTRKGCTSELCSLVSKGRVQGSPTTQGI